VGSGAKRRPRYVIRKHVGVHRNAEKGEQFKCKNIYVTNDKTKRDEFTKVLLHWHSYKFSALSNY
jgi:hypothetical protein